MQTNLDPRVARTRKAIIDSFIQLSEKIPFESISVKDITETALINRATFYNHFLDKYDLMEKALLEDVQISLNRKEYSGMPLDKNYIISIFESLTTFHLHLASQCQRSYIQSINRLVVDQLEVIHTEKLSTNFQDWGTKEVHKAAKLFASGIFSLSQDWYNNNSEQTPSEYIQEAMPFLLPFVGKL